MTTSCWGERTTSGTGGAFFQMIAPAASKAVKATRQMSTNQAGKPNRYFLFAVSVPAATIVVLAIAQPPKFEQNSLKFVKLFLN
jgi:hypothetical protein